MALTTYTAATDIIKTLGTNPEDRPTLTDDTFKAKFDENSENIKTFLNAMIAELASTANGKGASQIGIEDSAGKITATTVEAAFAELATLISTNDGKLTTHAALKTHIGANAACRVYRTTSQAVADSTNVPIAFTSERFDTDTMHDNVTNNTRITFTTAGKYIVTGNIYWQLSTTNRRELSIRLNGTTVIGKVVNTPDSASALCVQNVSAVYDFSANDYVELVALQVSGGALNVEAQGNYSPEFSAVRVG